MWSVAKFQLLSTSKFVSNMCYKQDFGMTVGITGGSNGVGHSR